VIETLRVRELLGRRLGAAVWEPPFERRGI